MQQQRSQELQFQAQPQVQKPKYREEQKSNRRANNQMKGRLDVDEYHPYEELTGKTVDAKEIAVDFYLDQAAEPEFKPLPKGTDQATQIQDTDLFDYELEVQPILQTIVGKTIDQSRMELIEEEEIKEFQQKRCEFQRKRNAELMVTQRMQAAQQRRDDEVQRRNLQIQVNEDLQKQYHKKLLSRNIAKDTLKNLKIDTIDELEQTDSYTNLRIHLNDWFMDQTKVVLDNRQEIRNLVGSSIFNLQNQIRENNGQAIQTELKRRQDIQDRIELEKKMREERIQRKKAHKLAKNISQGKTTIFESIKNTIIAQATVVEDILNIDINDLLSARQEVPQGFLMQCLVGFFGLIFGQIYLVLRVANKKGLIPSQNQDQIKKFIIHFINQNAKLNLNIKLNESYQVLIQQFQELQQQTPQSSTEINDFIDRLLQQDELFIYQNSQLLTQDLIDKQIYNDLFREIMKIYLFKSYDEENNDFDLDKAQQKIFLSYSAPVQPEIANFDCILRIRFPLQKEDPILEDDVPQDGEQAQQEQEQVQQEVKKEEVEEKPKQEEPVEETKNDLEFSFVEPYNGTTYENKLNEYREKIENEGIKIYNAAIMTDKNILIIDRRNQFFFRERIYESLLEQLNEEQKALIQDKSEFFDDVNSFYQEMEQTIINKLLEGKELDQVPIFDFDS